MIDLDRLDRKLLIQLDSNSRAPFSVLAKALRLGSDLIEYRYSRLKELGVIARNSVMINLPLLGFQRYKLYFRTSGDRRKVQSMISYFNSHERTWWLAETYGEWNLILSVLARSPDDFLNFQDSVLSKFNANIGNACLSTVARVRRFPRKFLLAGTSSVSMEEKGTSLVSLDDVDYSILRELTVDCRVPATTLAQQLNTTPAVVRYRIERMEKDGIILGYWTQVNHSKMDLLFVKILLSDSSHSPDEQSQLITFCERHQNVTNFIRQFGPFLTELELEVENFSQVHQCIEEFQDAFPRLSNNMQHLIVKRDYYHRFAMKFLSA